MGQDSTGQFVPPVRKMQTGVFIAPQGTISATDAASLKALNPQVPSDGMEAVLLSDRSRWVFRSASTAADTTENLVLTPGSSSGRWLRLDKRVHLKLAVAFGTADAAVLFTVPAGMRLAIDRVYWEITTSFTGGTSSAIGVSSSQAPHSTKGDLLGGTAGSVAAEITSTIGITAEPQGLSFTATPFVAVLEAASTIRFDRIVDAFTAGAGFVHVLVTQIS